MYKKLLLITMLSTPLALHLGEITAKTPTFNLVVSQDDVIQFSYDNAGNRIQRVIVMKTRVVEFEEDEQQPSFIEDSFEKQIIIYPNPTKGQLIIEVSDIDDISTGSLTILNLRGQIVLKEDVDQNKTYLDITKEPAGTYVLQIKIEDKTSTWKIVKQ